MEKSSCNCKKKKKSLRSLVKILNYEIAGTYENIQGSKAAFVHKTRNAVI